MLQNLLDFGVPEDEARVYLAMLELGGGYVSQIAKKAEKQRATCYHTLSNLERRGLARKIERGKRLFYSAEPPEHLVQLAQSRADSLREALPQLLSIQNTLASKPKISYFERTSGIEAIFEDTLSARGEILGYTNLEAMLELFPDFFRKYLREKSRRGIHTRYLSPYPRGGVDKLGKLLAPDEAGGALEVLFINREQFPFKNEIAIYGNKAALMSLSQNEHIGILIESLSVAQTLRAIFDLSWLGATSFVAV